ncbi:hypothetical protein QBC35DRAFT_548287 [Podospora australis]|uniref:Uncharacterized protein n=1 Tax=Podospora australis TaxID=1536484 RepID=A0AAN6WV19_9PEZI|nr:hypothetical protein QBC35DRAFT_548287 [Podospora australis]
MFEPACSRWLLSKVPPTTTMMKPNGSSVKSPNGGSVHSDPGTGIAPSSPVTTVASTARTLSSRTSVMSLIDLGANSLDIIALETHLDGTNSVPPYPACFPCVPSSLGQGTTPSLPASFTPARPEQNEAPRSSTVSLINLDEGGPIEAFPILEDVVIEEQEQQVEPVTVREPSLCLPTLGMIMDREALDASALDSPTIPRNAIEGSPERCDGDDSNPGNRDGGVARLPPKPQPPSEEVILGYGGTEAMRQEMERLIGSMWEHLDFAEEVVDGLGGS